MPDTRSIHLQKMAASINKAVREAEGAYKRENEGASNLSVKADVFVYPKRAAGFSGHPMIVLGWFFDAPATLNDANSLIVERLRKKYSPYNVPIGIMTVPLPAKSLNKIGMELRKRGIEIDLKSKNTLSKIKRALRSKIPNAIEARNYHPNISFNDVSVTVGDEMFPIQHHAAGYQRIRIGRAWLRCDVLETMLKPTS